MLTIPNNIMKPARYTGIEPNRVIKKQDEASLRFALCYPDTYEVGMSYYGYFLLYELANNVEGVWCERCFAPWQDMDIYLNQSGRPLTTLESKTPLSHMDLVGFSLSYELNITNVLNMLKLGGIPLRAAERERGPIVIGGGPLMLNPGPVEKFFDLIVVGEADETLLEILRICKERKGDNRSRIIEELAGIQGAYSPLYRKDSVKRQYIEDLDSAYHVLRPPIPVSGSIHNRLNIEVSRGCGNGCRFCIAGFGYRPYRERSFEKIKEIIDVSLRNTGYEDVSLLSLSSGDYSWLLQTIMYIREHHKGVSVSLPSLKIGSIGEDEIRMIGGIARTGFTFALESASSGIRCMLNKNIDVDMLYTQLPLLRKYGWRKLKIYFMIGFPGEKEGDLAIIREVIRPFEQAGIEVNLAVSPFIPKPHTPFQWLPMEDGDILREKMSMIKMFLKKKGAKVKYRDVTTSLIEGIISRGDESLSPLFEYLAEGGVRLEAWRECFKPELYYEWFDERGMDTKTYLGGREFDRPLPWDFIDTGIRKDFLVNEMGKAADNLMTNDCYAGCAGCGIGCPGAVKPLSSAHEKPGEPAGGSWPPVTGIESGSPKLPPHLPNFTLTKKFTLRYGKYGDARYLGHIDTMDILLRALRASGISIKMHGKYHPMPNIVLTDALPVGIESMCELMEIETEGRPVLDSNILKQINGALPAGMKVFEIFDVDIKRAAKESSYILISQEHGEAGELKVWKRNSKNSFYLWKGKGIKSLWQKGIFSRIIKVEDRKINGL